MKNIVQKRFAKNLPEFARIIVEVWIELDDELIMSLCASLLIRVNKCIVLQRNSIGC